MTGIKNFKNWIHGWFPQDSKVGIVRSINANLKPGRWVPLPFISGLLLIAAALLSIYFGSIFVNSYNSTRYVYYAGLPIAVLHLAALGLELVAATLLLIRKRSTIAVASMVIVLLLGLSIPLINMLDQPNVSGPAFFLFHLLLDPATWLNGLFLGSPMIAFSAAGLIIIALDRRRIQATPGISAPTAAATFAVFWSIIAAANIIQTNALANLLQTSWVIHLSLTAQFAWLLGGAALGAVIGVVVTRLQLNRLRKATKRQSCLRGWLPAIGAVAAVILLFTGFLSLELPADTQYGLLSGVFGSIAAVLVARTALFLSYEKRRDTLIRQNGLMIFLFPKESAYEIKECLIRKTPILLSLKSVILSTVVATGFAGLIFILSYSWIRTALIITVVLGCVVALVAKGKFKSITKYTVVSLMVFSLFFTAYESYTFSSAGGFGFVYWSSSPIMDISIRNMGNISVRAILNSLEQSQATQLLKLEQHDMGMLRGIEIRMAEKGHIAIRYSTKNANQSVDFYSPNGNGLAVRVYDDYSTYLNMSEQNLQTSLDQIDALGLEWFYNQALEIARNRTASLHSIDVVVFSLAYDTNLGGLSLGVSGRYSTPGSNYYPGVVEAAFQPNGTLISMATPHEK